MSPDVLYRELYRIRATEEACCKVYPSDKIQSPFHSSIGMELASVAVCAALKPGDAVYASYRSHAAYLAAGGSLDAFVAELYGKATGCCGGKGGSMHLAHRGPTDKGLKFMGTSAIVASLIPVAVGHAFAQKFLNTGAITVVFFGDGACEEGVFFESLNFAALHKLPILFVCENNGRAICSPIVDRQATLIRRRAGAMGVDAITADSFDRTLRVSAQMVESVRVQGPMLLESYSTRVNEHVGPESDLRAPYRSNETVSPDPLMEAFNDLSTVAAMNVRAQVDVEVAAAFRFAEESPFPGPEQLMADLYG